MKQYKLKNYMGLFVPVMNIGDKFVVENDLMFTVRLSQWREKIQYLFTITSIIDVIWV